MYELGFYVPFNSISVISERRKGEHERLCAMKHCFINSIILIYIFIHNFTLYLFIYFLFFIFLFFIYLFIYLFIFCYQSEFILRMQILENGSMLARQGLG